MNRLQNMGGEATAMLLSHRKAGSCSLLHFISKQLPADPPAADTANRSLSLKNLFEKILRCVFE